MNDVYVAKLGKTVGLKGEMKIHLDTDFPEQFKTDAIFTTNRNIKLTVSHFNQSRASIKFKNIDSIEDAKKLTNQELFTTTDDTKEMCKLNKKQFFWFDIIKCDIIDENDLNLGLVVDVHRYPITDYLEIQTKLELVEKGLPKTFLIPYSDDYIIDVSIDDKSIKTKGALAILENS